MTTYKSGKTHNDIMATPTLDEGCHEDKHMQVVSIAAVITNSQTSATYDHIIRFGAARHVKTRTRTHACTHKHDAHTPHTIRFGAPSHVKTHTCTCTHTTPRTHHTMHTPHTHHHPHRLVAVFLLKEFPATLSATRHHQGH